MQGWGALAITTLAWAVIPLLAFGLAGGWIASSCGKLPAGLRLILPALFGLPYLLAGAGPRYGEWAIFYLSLPVVVAIALGRAQASDPEQRGDWRDLLVLVGLGLAVDLRWLEPAWPAHQSVISKLILLDSGLYGFLVIRRLSGVGYDLRVGWKDVTTGLRELVFYAPIALPLGLLLGFLHWGEQVVRPGMAALTVGVTFFLIAIPEEIYFRGWMQNLLERRIGRTWSLLATAAIFGLSHFNKRAAHFNWRYVLLATIAGIFYGRAWREQRRIAASAITHACVDTVWAIWLQ